MGTNPARAIYGTILSTALIAAYSEDAGSDPIQIAGAVTAAALVFWLAHGYAEALARGVESEEGALASFSTALRREWPLVQGALPPIAPLFLSPLGLLSEDNAETLALITGIGLLTLWGTAIAWKRRPGLIGLALGAASSAFFGLVIVGLKAFVH